MPRNQGTSRKGKPKAAERRVGLGRALQRAHRPGSVPRSVAAAAADGAHAAPSGMQARPGVASLGLADDTATGDRTRSVLELSNVDDFLLQADLANRAFLSEREAVVVVDATAHAYRPSQVRWSDHSSTDGTRFVFQELCVPRRPPWDAATSPAQLERQEQQAFLEWRRGIAAREEDLQRRGHSSGSHAAAAAPSVTPFEKNLEVWRQLWRVLERSACLLQLVDARNPLFYLSDDLKAYAADLGKPMLVLVNKSDYLSRRQRRLWADHFAATGWECRFFSAMREQAKLDAAAHATRRAEAGLARDPRRQDDDDNAGTDDIEEEEEEEEAEEDSHDSGEEKLDGSEHRRDMNGLDSHKSAAHEPATAAAVPDDSDSDSLENAIDDAHELSQDGVGVDVPLSREQLLDSMMAFAAQHQCQPDPRHDNRVQFGMVGFPNVGKSSVINVCVGSSKHTHGVVRVAVASQPGKTKHFQTLLLPDRPDMMLCDCPGLVFPSFVSNTADLIAAGVYPIAQMRDHWPVIELICQRIPREIINALYGISLPVPTELEMLERGLTELPPPTAEEFLTTLCVARSMLAASSGVPDFTRAARMVIKDYAAGRLLYCHPPPSVTDQEAFSRETISTAVNNTQKLRSKLERQQELQKEAEQALSERARDVDLVDDDLLELLDHDTTASATITSTNDKKHHKQPKGGKKGKKKVRKKDPYGCNKSTEGGLPTYSSGVSVKAGKHSGSGYTRPTYVGIRSARIGSES